MFNKKRYNYDDNNHWSDEQMGNPIIHKTSYSLKGIDELNALSGDERRYLLEYPTVYVLNSGQKKKSDSKYDVYVGEANSITHRTKQHLQAKENDKVNGIEAANMYVIGDEFFNKSMTLDIENRLIDHFMGNDSILSLNGRGNEQGSYYDSTVTQEIFENIWNQLHKDNENLVPSLSVITSSAVFKASPFKTLSTEQRDAKNMILESVVDKLHSNETGQLILVSGGAGTGKTVLLSTLFYELSTRSFAKTAGLSEALSSYLVVNHDEQVTVYEQVAKKLGIGQGREHVVTKPTKWLNAFQDSEQLADVVLIDEAHLLWTQGKQAYRGKNQLDDILKKSKVVIAIFDERQILRSEQHLTHEQVERLMNRANEKIELKHQFRIDANDATVDWIESFVQGEIKAIPEDDSYELKIFDNVSEMYTAIKERNNDSDKGLARMLATFDWPFKEKGAPTNGDKYWMVKTDGVGLPWNLQTATPADKRRNKGLSWAEADYSINEVGSTYTIQGFDLNYAGLIIGPSVVYRDGRVAFDPTASQNKSAIKRRDGIDYGIEHLQNELNVLIKRGVHGLFIYAVDDELRKALNKAAER